MSQELIAIIIAAIGLAALIVPGQRAIRSDIAGLRGAHGAPGGAAGRVARSDHQPVQSQLTVSCVSCRGATEGN